jgi:NAD-dependent dihydropyrimidine dehydrogenase PreA subunit
MRMVIRKIIRIDEELCNGCGLCIPNCAEGALQIVDGKAVLLSDIYCDGLGACLGHCPEGAISMIERAAKAFDEEAVHAHLARQHALESGCPSATVQKLEAEAPAPAARGSALRHWPVQLNLVPVEAPFFKGAELLVVADCVPVAYPDLHSSFLSGRSVVVGCPKFDDAGGYAEKLGEILRRNEVKSVIIAHMEVPCCSCLTWVVDRAVEASGKQIPVERCVITVRGEIR